MFGLSTFLWASNVAMLWKRVRICLVYQELGNLATRLALANTSTNTLRYMTDILFIVEVSAFVLSMHARCSCASFSLFFSAPVPHWRCAYRLASCYSPSVVSLGCGLAQLGLVGHRRSVIWMEYL
jgi:hypothetical protein